jgi:glycosyltransferase involved in cell wall biosynthesis
MKVAVVIPVYNHHQRVVEVIERSRMLGLEVIVIDDGSTDVTSALLATVKDIVLLRHPVNQGKGAALLTGFTAAAMRGCEYALTIDGDGQHSPEDGGALLAAAEQERQRVLVVGARQGMAGEHVPWTSCFGRGFSNFWVWAGGGPWIGDSQSGFRLYPLPEVFSLGVQAHRYQFEVEILVRAAREKIPIIEVPVSVVYHARGVRVSHFRPWRDFWRNSATFSRLLFSRFFAK